jgi:hypothetical protein
MKSFLKFFSEARTSQASDQAGRRGWTGDGHGNWFDKTGELVARTERGRLVEIKKKVAAAPEVEQPKQKAAEPTEAEAKASQADLTAQEEGEFGMFPDGTPRRMAAPTRADGTPKEDRGDLTIAFGRFNPPHAGHQKVFDAAKKAAGKGELRIYPSRSEGKKTDPLDANTKHEYLAKMFPDYASSFVNDPDSRTIFDVLKQAHDDGYSSVHIIAGGKRVQEFEKLSHDYNGKLYDFSAIETISAGERDESKKGGLEGASASKLRKAAEEDRFYTTYYPKGHKKAGEIEDEGFEEYLPKSFREDEKLAKQLFNTVKKQLKSFKKEKVGVKEGLWQIAPKLDWKNLRENYIAGNIFNVGQLVENLNTGLVGRIIRRGTSYLICVTEDNIMFKSWIKDLSEKKKVKPASQTGLYGVPASQREVGTSSHREYAQSMVPGQEEIKNFNIQEFLNKYRKKRS